MIGCFYDITIATYGALGRLRHRVIKRDVGALDADSSEPWQSDVYVVRAAWQSDLLGSTSFVPVSGRN